MGVATGADGRWVPVVGRAVVRGASAVGLGAVMTGVVAGLGWLSMWVVYHWVFLHVVEFVVMLVAAAALFLGLAAGMAYRPAWWKVSVASFVVFAAGWLVFDQYCVSMADQQALHDRGTTVPAVVVKVHKGDQNSSTTVEVRLADGSTHGDVELGDWMPRTGEQTVVTLDPSGPARSRLGPPPGPPDATARNAGLAAVAVGSVGLGAHLTGLLETAPLRKPRPPEDAPPAGPRRRQRPWQHRWQG
ncbi:hypothetical protein OG401_40160 [Kitasatospora purpeofusca]|uniref:hypothetical protein n=1 Tax=Kitasatospora purpeofusca TaxID=67352 RepID=UPI002251836F|nr:hypothetical protein [Kitasatospora purpeofusca]MCX4690439.1 hypothetical protein [Kitasatospora purpeofusca]